MFCPKCGTQNYNGEKFCKNCGNLIENNNVEPTMNSNMNNNQPAMSQNMNNNNQSAMGQNMNNVSGNEANSKLFGILSIVIPVLGILLVCFGGISLIFAVIAVALSLEFSKRSKNTYPSLAKAGTILSIVFIVLYFIMIILNVILLFLQ